MVGKIFKRIYMKMRILGFKSVGKNFIFDPFSNIVLPKQFTANNNVFIGPKAYISAEIFFHDNVMVGPGLTVIGGDHKFGVKGHFNRFLTNGENQTNKVIIGKDAWIGANVTILKGVTIGDGAIIGAGSLVTNSIPPFKIAYGNPCRSMRDVFESDDDLLQHLKLLEYSDGEIDEIFNRRVFLNGK